jgi:hypothetical protein
MSLKNWLAAGWLRPHKATLQEITNLWLIADRDLQDAASGGISHDWQFGITYNAALKLCTIVLYAEGYHPEKGNLAHYRTLQALPLILDVTHKGDGDYLEACRRKRTTVEYDRAGGATANDAREFLEFTQQLRTDALAWLVERHPALVPLEAR